MAEQEQYPVPVQPPVVPQGVDNVVVVLPDPPAAPQQHRIPDDLEV
jgi:hypothetical protein